MEKKINIKDELGDEDLFIYFGIKRKRVEKNTVKQDNDRIKAMEKEIKKLNNIIKEMKKDEQELINQIDETNKRNNDLYDLLDKQFEASYNYKKVSDNQSKIITENELIMKQQENEINYFKNNECNNNSLVYCPICCQNFYYKIMMGIVPCLHTVCDVCGQLIKNKINKQNEEDKYKKCPLCKKEISDIKKIYFIDPQ